MRIVNIVGARPQFIKLAPVCREIEDRAKNGRSRIENLIVHTGQHYDTPMSDIFFEELGIPRPTVKVMD